MLTVGSGGPGEAAAVVNNIFATGLAPFVLDKGTSKELGVGMRWVRGGGIGRRLRPQAKS